MYSRKFFIILAIVLSGLAAQHHYIFWSVSLGLTAICATIDYATKVISAVIAVAATSIKNKKTGD
jgi:hypothetical protein